MDVDTARFRPPCRCGRREKAAAPPAMCPPPSRAAAASQTRRHFTRDAASRWSSLPESRSTTGSLPCGNPRTPARRDEFLKTVALHSPVVRGYIDLPGECDLAQDQPQDSAGDLPPVTARRIIPERWEPPDRLCDIHLQAVLAAQTGPHPCHHLAQSCVRNIFVRFTPPIDLCCLIAPICWGHVGEPGFVRIREMS